MESIRFYLPRDWQQTPNEPSDLFALGSTMYYIATSCVPYANLPDEEVTARYQREEFSRVDGLRCGKAIMGCWTGMLGNAEEVRRAILAEGLPTA